jgi:hypothetical protein
MFSLTLVDHLRLTFSQITQRYNAHAAAATSRARWSRLLRGAEAFLMAVASVAAVAAAFGQARAFIIAVAVLASLAVLVLVIHLTFDFERSAQMHASSSASLWRIRERYRSLLSDLNDGVIDVAEARARRDRLIEELGGILEHADIVAVQAASGEDDVTGVVATPGSPAASVPT